MKIHTDGFFSVAPKYGLLLIKEPLASLPAPYVALQALIEAMPIRKAGNSAGLFAEDGVFQIT